MTDQRGEALVKVCLGNPSILYDLPDGIAAAMPCERTRAAMEAMLAVSASGDVPDAVKVIDWLSPHKNIEARLGPGWIGWLSSLLDGTEPTQDPVDVAEKLIEAHALQEQRLQLERLLKEAAKPGFRLSDLSERLITLATDSPKVAGHNCDFSSEKSINVICPAQENLKWVPFPVDVLPPVLSGFVTAAAKSIGCDPSMIACPTLVACAACIGNTRRVALKSLWSEPPILWCGIVAESGSHKSPAQEISWRTVRDIQRKAIRQHQALMEQFVRDRQQWEKSSVEWKRSKTGGEPPEEPKEPKSWRLLFDDATLEAVVGLLADNPRGLMLAVDELSGWLGSFDKYRSKGAGGDAAKWLEVHGGRTLLIDRKTGNPRTICIPRAAVSICGGIQPEILSRAMTATHRASGLSARLLLCCPPRRKKRWTDAELHRSAVEPIEHLYRNLLDLQMQDVEGDDPVPVIVKLSTDAKRRFKEFYNQHADEQSTMTGELAATWSKLEAYAPRLALIIHMTRFASGEAVDADVVDLQSLEAGITLARWFGNEARRVNATYCESGEEAEDRKLLEWIEAAGGVVSTRDVQRGLRTTYGSAGQVDAAFRRLSQAGHGQITIERTTRRPRVIFQMLCAGQMTQFAETQQDFELCPTDFQEDGFCDPFHNPEPEVPEPEQFDDWKPDPEPPRMARQDMSNRPPWIGQDRPTFGVISEDDNEF